MPIHVGREDVRLVKTEKALDDAMFSLLRQRNYKKITVKDICDAALISRATFYAHFSDKYDYLKDWLIRFLPVPLDIHTSYEIVEYIVNQFIYSNAAVIKNLIISADDETNVILYDYLLSTLGFEVDKMYNGQINPHYVVLHNFCAGGIVNYFRWQIKNKFPLEVKPMNDHLYKLLTRFQEFHVQYDMNEIDDNDRGDCPR